MAGNGKPIESFIKLQVPAGKANPSPPVGPALGQHGVNIMEFCQRFNAETKDIEPGMAVPVVISVYKDRSFSFIVKSPPAAVLLRKAAGIAKGSSVPNKDKVATLKVDDLRGIAEAKMKDLNAGSMDAAIRIIAGTARSMGIVVEGLEGA